MKLKKFFVLSLFVLSGILITKAQPTPTNCAFALSSVSGGFTVTCNSPNVLITTSVTSGGPFTYAWLPSCSGTLTGASQNFTQSCSGSVIGTATNGCTHTQTFVVYANFTSPTVAITPTNMNITCSTSATSFTGTSNLGPNVTTNWFQVAGSNTIYVGVPQGTINIFQPSSPGIYYMESVNNLTGCKSTKSVQVTASVGVPVFTVTSPSNFTVGCSTSSITSMQVTSVITSPVPSVACQYTFVPPGFTGTPTTFSFNPNQNNIILPGTWVVWVRDQTNNCVSSQSISIIQNTIAPNVDFIQPLSILTCKEPTMVLNGLSTNPNTTITWTVPAIPSNSVNPTPNATCVINPAATGATANITSVGTWTVGAVDNNNLCRATKTVQIIQDIRLPIFTISAASNSIINCKDPSVLIVPVIGNTLAAALVPTYTWIPPVGSPASASSYNTLSPGTHTALSISSVNGCTTSATINVASDLTAPALVSAGLFTLDCATNPTVSIIPVITGSTTGFTYSWTVPAGAITSNLTSSLLTSNSIGNYTIVVTNTINGCKSNADYTVVPGAINADFTPNPSVGYAPLVVTFNNNSSTSTGASSIISSYGFGNGSVLTGTNLTMCSTTYTAAGIYKVYLKVQKGACIDTVLKTIEVMLPSKIEVPNVFTPNGDKSNDYFRLKATNLSEINVTIFDRWGNVVYEVTSTTGNFEWDGKNQQGKECAQGVYFYTIKAKGKDNEEYDQKGNVSLFR